MSTLRQPLSPKSTEMVSANSNSESVAGGETKTDIERSGEVTPPEEEKEKEKRVMSDREKKQHKKDMDEAKSRAVADEPKELTEQEARLEAIEGEFICYDLCNAFNAVLFMSAWNLLASATILTVAVYGATGKDLTTDNDTSSSLIPNFTNETLQVLLGLFIVPGIVRFVSGVVGFWLVPKLKHLVMTEYPKRRPDDYNEYERIIDWWNWCVFWLPMCDMPLVFLVLLWIMDVTDTDGERDTWVTSTSWTWAVFVAIFLAASLDVTVSLLFYRRFKQFIEETFHAFLFACPCFCCPGRCKQVCPDPRVGPKKCC